MIAVSIVTPVTFNGCWYGHLYSYSVGGWEQKWASCGSSPIGNVGWTMWEHTGVALVIGGSQVVCRNSGAPSIRSTDILAHVVNLGSSTPVPLESLGPFGGITDPCWSGYSPPGLWTFEWPFGQGLGSAWKANTPYDVVPPPLDVDVLGQSPVKRNALCTWAANPSGGLTPYTYVWRKDGATMQGETGVQVNTSFSTTGIHTLRVVVTDAVGVKDSSTKNISVTTSAQACPQ